MGSALEVEENRLWMRKRMGWEVSVSSQIDCKICRIMFGIPLEERPRMRFWFGRTMEVINLESKAIQQKGEPREAVDFLHFFFICLL